MRTLLATTAAVIIMHVFNIISISSITTNSTEVRLDNDIMIYESHTNVSVIKTVIKKKLLL